MVFNSPEFLAFLAVTLAVYALLPHRGQNIFLLAASYFFYGWWDYRFLGLIVASTAIDYVAAAAIGRAHERDDRRGARPWLLVSVGANLGILGVFKYFNFFAASAQAAMEAVGWSTNAVTLEVVLPVGISFYTFQSLSYTIDVYRKKMAPTRNPLDFALYVAFFPQLVAGPIERARVLLPQIQARRIIDAEHVRRGCWLILIGLFRKVAISDTAAQFVDVAYADPSQYAGPDWVFVLILYSLQIYGDFSGYSNIARGCARLMGFELMRNFQHPYIATSPSDFWRRWHISLSTWLRDYLYIPLGGNRGRALHTARNVAVTMLLGGLWHGASWNFVVWGALHGFYLIVDRAIGSRAAPATSPRLRRALHAAFIFALVSVTWVFFRSPDWATTGDVFAQLGSGWGAQGGELLWPATVLVALMCLIDGPQIFFDDELAIARLPVAGEVLVGGAMILVIFFGGTASAAPFIYFQF